MKNLHVSFNYSTSAQAITTTGYTTQQQESTTTFTQTTATAQVTSTLSQQPVPPLGKPVPPLGIYTSASSEPVASTSTRRHRLGLLYKLHKNRLLQQLTAVHIARIKASFAGGKRLTSKQVRVLLENVSGIIAESDMISRHFPMDEDLIDLLRVYIHQN